MIIENEEFLPPHLNPELTPLQMRRSTLVRQRRMGSWATWRMQPKTESSSPLSASVSSALWEEGRQCVARVGPSCGVYRSDASPLTLGDQVIAFQIAPLCIISFATDLVETITQVHGANYLSVHTPGACVSAGWS